MQAKGTRAASRGLDGASRRSNGEIPPKDLVEGSAAVDLNQLILDLKAELDCR